MSSFPFFDVLPPTSTGSKRRLISYQSLAGDGKSFTSYFSPPDLWQLFERGYKRPFLEDEIKSFSFAVGQNDKAFYDKQRKMQMIGECAASVLSTKSGLPLSDLEVLMYLMQTSGERWSSEDPWYILNKCLALHSLDFQTLFDCRGLLCLALDAINKLPVVTDAKEFCWAALVPTSDLDSVFRSWEFKKDLFSASFISAVPNMDILKTVVESACESLPDVDSAREEKALFLFRMDVVSDLPKAHNLSVLNPRGEVEYLLNPGFLARIIDFRDYEPVAGMKNTILVRLSFLMDKDYFNSVLSCSDATNDVPVSRKRTVFPRKSADVHASVNSAVLEAEAGNLAASKLDSTDKQNIKHLSGLVGAAVRDTLSRQANLGLGDVKAIEGISRLAAQAVADTLRTCDGEGAANINYLCALAGGAVNEALIRETTLGESHGTVEDISRIVAQVQDAVMLDASAPALDGEPPTTRVTRVLSVTNERYSNEINPLDTAGVAGAAGKEVLGADSEKQQEKPVAKEQVDCNKEQEKLAASGEEVAQEPVIVVTKVDDESKRSETKAEKPKKKHPSPTRKHHRHRSKNKEGEEKSEEKKKRKKENGSNPSSESSA